MWQHRVAPFFKRKNPIYVIATLPILILYLTTQRCDCVHSSSCSVLKGWRKFRKLCMGEILSEKRKAGENGDNEKLDEFFVHSEGGGRREI